MIVTHNIKQKQLEKPYEGGFYAIRPPKEFGSLPGASSRPKIAMQGEMELSLLLDDPDNRSSTLFQTAKKGGAAAGVGSPASRSSLAEPSRRNGQLGKTTAGASEAFRRTDQTMGQRRGASPRHSSSHYSRGDKQKKDEFFREEITSETIQKRKKEREAEEGERATFLGASVADHDRSATASRRPHSATAAASVRRAGGWDGYASVSARSAVTPSTAERRKKNAVQLSSSLHTPSRFFGENPVREVELRLDASVFRRRRLRHSPDLTTVDRERRERDEWFLADAIRGEERRSDEDDDFDHDDIGIGAGDITTILPDEVRPSRSLCCKSSILI